MISRTHPPPATTPVGETPAAAPPVTHLPAIDDPTLPAAREDATIDKPLAPEPVAEWPATQPPTDEPAAEPSPSPSEPAEPPDHAEPATFMGPPFPPQPPHESNSSPLPAVEPAPSSPAVTGAETAQGNSTQAGASERPGDLSDRESDPTSIINAPPAAWRMGKPMASPGMEIRTVRPSPTVLQSLTVMPGNAVFRVSFDRTGKPALVTLLETSGDGTFDKLMQSCLYRWRASGARIDGLAHDTDRVDVTIRLLMRGRARA